MKTYLITIIATCITAIGVASCSSYLDFLKQQIILSHAIVALIIIFPLITIFFPHFLNNHGQNSQLNMNNDSNEGETDQHYESSSSLPVTKYVLDRESEILKNGISTSYNDDYNNTPLKNNFIQKSSPEKSVQKEDDGTNQQNTLKLSTSQDNNEIIQNNNNVTNNWRCACEGGFLPPGLLKSFSGMEAVIKMGSGQCYHKV